MTTTSISATQSEHEGSGLGPVGLRFRSILVATDCCPASATAVKMAARLAKEFHAKLYVLHAVMPGLYGVGTPGPVPELAAVDLEVSSENLHKYAEHIPELRTVAHKELVFLGPPSEGIRSAGESHDIDLLVLGSHGRKGLAKLTIGSVAEWAINRLHYPVLVAGPRCDKTYRPMRSIVLATDLTEQALRPAQYAACIAKDYGARLTTVSVLPEGSTGKQEAGAGLTTIQELRQLMPRDCADWCTLKFDVRTGEIAPAILQSARENKANLIVLGARHKAPLADHMPRTKLSAIIREAHCPVLLVPPHRS